MDENRVLSGMRPTGALHLGHYHGVLENWLAFQNEHECYFFVADWHALTTHYGETSDISADTEEMVVVWLSSGIDASRATVFVQSHVPEHAELYLLLSMICPISWLERMPSYKEMRQEMSAGHELDTYGFLGYPLLQSADILAYRPTLVPVGADQAPHVEFTREVARRFNYFYGRGDATDELVKQALDKLGDRKRQRYLDARQKYLEGGKDVAHKAVVEGIRDQRNLTAIEIDVLEGNFEGGGRTILPEPDAVLTESSKMIGLDGRKMSKSYNNTILIMEEKDSLFKKIKDMPTDPARVRLKDPGEPEKCPIWPLHLRYSAKSRCDEIAEGCRGAKIGCKDCKNFLASAISGEFEPFRERAQKLRKDPAEVKDILSDGAKKARKVAGETLEEVKEAMGISV